MTNAFDPRRMTITISAAAPLASGVQGPVQSEQIIFTSTAAAPGLDMRVRGKYFAGSTMGQAEIKISNMTRQQRNNLITMATPIIPVNANRTPAYVTVDAGRDSYGVFRLFEGTCWAAAVTQAPDMTLTLSSLTNSIQSSTVGVTTEGILTPLSVIVQKIAALYKWTPKFMVKNDRQIANFQFTGSGQTAINKLEEIGNVNVFLVNGVLTVIDRGSFVGPPAPINLQSGMVGVPQANEWGIQVKTLIRPDIQLGGAVQVMSQTNPACNGTWTIKQLGFEVTNRDDPFWYDILGVNNIIYSGAM